MISTTDEDPAERELEAYHIVYDTLCIVKGLIDDVQYRASDSISMGVSLWLFMAARRCFSLAWQQWIIGALRKIGREGLSNGLAYANTLEIMCDLESRIQRPANEGSPLGSIRTRLFPLIMPPTDDNRVLVYYLRYGNSMVGWDERAVEVVAKASWRQGDSGVMESLELDVIDTSVADPDTLEAPELFSPWRQSVEWGWHGYLTYAGEAKSPSPSPS